MNAEAPTEFWNFSDTKVLPASDTLLLDSLFSEKVFVHVLLGYLHWNLQTSFVLGTCCGNLQYKDNGSYKLRKCQLKQISMAFLVSYVTLSLPFACVAWK